LASSGDADAPCGAPCSHAVRDLAAAHRELVAYVVREPRREPWGLEEMWIADPDGTRIVLVQVPENHPMRRDPRS